MVRIGRVGKGAKVHMHVDGVGCGAGRRARMTSVISTDMLMWVKPADLCKRCFTTKRMELVAQINAYGHRWDMSLENFLNRVPAARELQCDRTSAERLEEMRREILARFRAEGVTV